MKNKKLLIIIALVLAVVCVGVGILFLAPNGTTDPTGPIVSGESVDYASSVKLDMNSPYKKQEVTVKLHIDGDTVHFNVPNSVNATGVLKARFLAVNTPESTGKIEEYGKTASDFTKEKLKNAQSIYIESDTTTWDADSTGDRYLCWIWYKPKGESEYRNLNIELLQEGLAIASNSGGNRYGTTCMAAISQAQNQKLHVYSGKKDPNFFYGESIEMDLKELRTNIQNYENQKVAFTGVITMHYNNGVFVEQYDAESQRFFGMYVYVGFSFAGGHLLEIGNEVRFAGSVTNFNGSWQVSGLSFSEYRPKDDDIRLISEGNEAAFVLTTPQTFKSKVDLTLIDPITEQAVTKAYPYAELAMGTSIEMKNLKVVDIYTTQSENPDSNGAMSITVMVDGVRLTVRTIVLQDETGKIITADAYMGKTIDVKGIVDCFNGEYQVKVLTADHIIVH
jgi:endonuclease YncB( thermonuclease family)